MGKAFIGFGATISLLLYFSDFYTKQTAEGIYMLSGLSIFFGLVCLTSPKRAL